MKHARQQIFAHVKSLLEGVARKVEIQTPHDVEKKHESHIDIHYTSDVKDLERKTMGEDANTMNMVIVITVKGYALTSAAPQADDIALKVELVLGAPVLDVHQEAIRDGVHTIKGATVDIDLDSSDLEQETGQEAVIAKLYMNYSVFYRTPSANPALLV